MNNPNPQKYWFKRRRYGYGWLPVTWQGWLTIIVFLAVVFGGMVILKDTRHNEFSIEVVWYLLLVFLDIVVVTFIARKKGPAPKWRWGKSDKDNPEEDF